MVRCLDKPRLEKRLLIDFTLQLILQDGVKIDDGVLSIAQF